MRDRAERPKVIAHRGLSSAAPENTIDAFLAAADLGADGVELDVRRTADGRLVVHHDAAVGGVVIAASSRTEVVAAGRGLGYEIPALAEVLAALRGRLDVDVEIKETGHERQVLAEATAGVPQGRLVITTFHASSIASLRALAPALPLGLLVGGQTALRATATYTGDLVGTRRRARRVGATFLAPYWRFVATRATRSVHLGSMHAWVWGVNDQALMRALSADPRVEAVITDEPALALDSFGSRR